jgi:aspartate/methionine/tyrosine aminotransferase
MTEAEKHGHSYGNPEWVNLGQGAPETGDIPDAPPRMTSIDVDVRTNEYSPVAGMRELREAVAELYNRRYRQGKSSKYTAENVAIASGGRLSLSRLAASLGRTHVGHFLPDYTAYEELLEQFERFIPIPIPLDPAHGYAFSAKELEEEIISRGLSALLLSNPCNPTGKLVGGAQLSAWIRKASELDCCMLFDEFYSNYIWDPVASKTGSGSAAEHVGDVNEDEVVIFDGLTKNWRYPGWRVGWTVAPKHIIDRVASVGSFMDGGASHPMQRAALQVLDPDIADQEAEAIRKHFGPKREIMLKRLVGMGIRVDAAPAGAFYVWGNVSELPEGMNTGMDFFRAALEHKVISVPGEFFDVNPGKRRSAVASRFHRFVRFSFGPTMESITEGLDRLEAMIEGNA